ncbi:c-type cytochrome [Thalassotalea maritima]|uniref:c-type cytochrome n=1 Tax=Thalassotalea maritima TaxID=3242416 RepID=UPI003527F92B
MKYIAVSGVLFATLCITNSHAEAVDKALIEAGKQQALVCKTCHQFNADGKSLVGPPLWGLAERDIASYQGFNYSESLTQLKGRWDAGSLDAFLKAPENYAPGTNMLFSGVKDAGTRAAIIAWLGTSNPNPINWRTSEAEQTPLSAGEGVLKSGDNMGLVASACSSCHSLHLVAQQGLSRDSWDETLQWMIDEQGMEPLDPDDYQAVLDYLSTHYGL